jgi:hypothetical protein
VERLAWTDERLDDLATRMDAGFDRVERDLRDLRVDMNQRFVGVDHRFVSMDQRFTSIDHRFVAMDQRFNRLDATIKWFGGGIMLTILAATLAVLLGGS